MTEVPLKQVTYQVGPNGYEASSSIANAQNLRGIMLPEEVEYEDLSRRIKEANENYMVVRSRGGITHEFILFNEDEYDNGLVFKPSTSFSSGLKNPGNVLEAALAATVNPETSYLYWASFGNFPTGHLTRGERNYFRKTGRFTMGDGSEDRPYASMDSVKDLVETLYDNNLAPTHFAADQEAGRLALAVMAEMEKNTVKGAHFNGIDGISPAASYVASSFMEDMQSRVRRRRMGDGKAGEVTPVNLKDLKDQMPTVYTGMRRYVHLAPIPAIVYPRDVRDKIGHILATRGHDDLEDLADHAVYHDMSAALRKQKATLALQFNTDSKRHELTACEEFGRLVMNNIPQDLRDDKRGLVLLIGEGEWTANTDDPYAAARIQRQALGSDIKREMSSLPGGSVLDAQILALGGLRQVAA